MRSLWRSFLLVAALFTVGCALPTDEIGQSESVPRSDLEVVALSREAMSLYQRGRFVDAELALRQAVWLNPAPNLKANLATVLAAAGQLEEAKGIYTELLQREVGSVPYREGFADVLVRLGEYPEARKIYAALLDEASAQRDFTRMGEISRLLATLAFRLGDEEGAWCHSAQAYTYSQSIAELQRHVRVLFALNRVRHARALLEEYASRNPSTHDPTLLYMEGLAALTLGDVQRALAIRQTLPGSFTGGDDHDGWALFDLLTGDQAIEETAQKLADLRGSLSPRAWVSLPPLAILRDGVAHGNEQTGVVDPAI